MLLWLSQEKDTLANPVLCLFLSQAFSVMLSNSIKTFGRWPLTAHNSFSGCSAWDMWALTCSSCYSPSSHWNQCKSRLLSVFVSAAPGTRTWGKCTFLNPTAIFLTDSLGVGLPMVILCPMWNIMYRHMLGKECSCFSWNLWSL